MKKNLLLFIVFFASVTGFSQNTDTIPTLFEVIDHLRVSKAGVFEDGKKKNHMMDNPMNTEIRKVRFQNLYRLASGKSKGTEKSIVSKSPGHFKFSLPRGNKTKREREILAIPTHIEAGENGDYQYIAELVRGKNTKGHLVLIHEGGRNFGSMTLGDRSFRIESDKKEGDLLIELNKRMLGSKVACATELLSKENSSSTSKATFSSARAASSNANKTVRVLVLYTNRADHVSNPAQLARTMVAETNSTLRNSKINSGQLNFTLVGTRNIVFNEGRNPVDDLRNAVANAGINNLRNNLGADLVVVLTDGNYLLQGGRVLGIAALNDYSRPNAGHVALVEADAGNYTFSHEVGHLMGGRHDTDTRTRGGAGALRLPDNLSPTAKGHSWYKRNCFICQKLYRKSMVADGRTRGLRTMYYSNPAVKSESKARDNTGTSARNNYRQLIAAAPVVAAYHDFEPMTVGISGPSTVNVGDSYTVSARVGNCSNRTYRWEVSYDGFTYYSSGTRSSVSSRAYPYNGSLLSYRLTVTCSDGQRRTAYKTIYVYGTFPGYPRALASKAQIQQDSVPRSQVEVFGEEKISFYPNPASDQVNLGTNFGTEKRITVHTYNILKNGSHKRLFKGKVPAGPNKLGLDISRLNQGLYQLVVKSGGTEIFGKRLVISR